MHKPVIRSVEKQDDRVVMQLSIPAGLAYFKGHFPGNPVLPGVVQTHWAIHFACEYLGTPETIQKLEVVKFQNLILPGMDLVLTLELKANGKLQFSYQCDEKRMSSGRIVFRGQK
ncbi:hypothetical protein [Endozoicomonas sp. Mp262]|uniref:3-hydroxyacyl-ACP dehydratase FabZ family protein n=1 Tax=Endozoicomonas sp. Mp262 TaxID=2919499 RepID=UPI0021D9E8EE